MQIKKYVNPITLGLLGLCLSLTMSSEIDAKSKSSPKLSSSSIVLSKGKTAKIKVLNSNKQKVSFKSSNKRIASVSANGTKAIIKGKQKGKCTITATIGKKKRKCEVMVETPYRSTSKLVVKVDKSKVVSINGTCRKIKYSIKDKSIAEITDYGVVTGNSVGKTEITAKISDKTFTIPVTVLPSTYETPSIPMPTGRPQPTQNPFTNVKATSTPIPDNDDNNDYNANIAANYMKNISYEQLPSESSEYHYYSIYNNNDKGLILSGAYLGTQDAFEPFYIAGNHSSIVKVPITVTGFNFTGVTANNKYTDITDKMKLISSGRDEIASAYTSNYVVLKNISDEFNISEIEFVEIIKNAQGQIFDVNTYKVNDKKANIEFKYLTSDTDYVDEGLYVSYYVNYAYSNQTRYFDVWEEDAGVSSFDGAVSYSLEDGATASDLRFFQIYKFYNKTNSDVIIHSYVNPYTKNETGTTYYGLNVKDKYNESWDSDFNWNQFKNFAETKSYIKKGNWGYILVPKKEYYTAIYKTNDINIDKKFIGESIDNIKTLSASSFLSVNTNNIEKGDKLGFDITKDKSLAGKEVTATILIPFISQGNRLLTVIADTITIPADVETWHYETPLTLQLNDKSDKTQEYITGQSYIDEVFFMNVFTR